MTTRRALFGSALRHLAAGRTETGIASYYGPRFDGRRTASGARFDRWAMTAAHRTLPFGTRALVTNLLTGARVVLTINDRGPYVRGRFLDVSQGAARALGGERDGVFPAELQVL